MERRVSTISPIWKDFSDVRKKAGKSACEHRIGPAPIEDYTGGDENAANMGTLDSDMEDDPTDSDFNSKNVAGSRALIIYFSKIAKKKNADTIDYHFLHSLFKSGANIDASDKYGQTALFEVARNWHIDVAKFFIHFGADMNHTDKMGRTPLHLASACNHYEMVEYLLVKGANINAKTNGEKQTPIHYAAKFNSVACLKVLIEHKANINSRDYKKRTPIFMAAELGQEDSARYLLDFGAPVGVFDDSGMSAIGCMVEKMPNVALDALNQFHLKDTSFRKDSFFLNYLEYDPARWNAENKDNEKSRGEASENKLRRKKYHGQKSFRCPTTALQLAVKLQEFDIIMHPVMQHLIKQKWKLYGKFWAVVNAVIHLIYIFLWTWDGAFLPRDGDYKTGMEWRVSLEVLAVLMTFYFILKQIWEKKIAYRDNQIFRTWRKRQINRDMEYCHPRWPQEKTFLQNELKALRSGTAGFTSDPWNFLDLITYVGVVIVITTQVVYMFLKTELAEELHLKSYAVLLIFMWLHFMKSCRPFTSIGPFITMLGHVMKDTGKFAFLFFEFFIPYTIGFWILFGGPEHAKMMDDADANSVDWKNFQDLVFSVWQVTLNVDFNLDGLYAVHRSMAQVMVGTFFALSTVLCLNLYIALLSETFNQVYQNAKANASLLQANTIFQIEKALSKKKMKESLRAIQEDCAPLESDQEEDEAGMTEEELWDRTIRSMLSRFSMMEEFLRVKLGLVGSKQVVNQEQLTKQKYNEAKETYDIYQELVKRDKELYELQIDIYELKCAALMYLGEDNNIPPAPMYKPLPVLDIKPPPPLQDNIRGKKKLARENKKHDDIPRENKKHDDNELFKRILEEKGPKGFGSQLLEVDEELTGSWENLPNLPASHSTNID